MPVAIKVEKLSKAYQLGEIGTGTVSRDIERWLARVRGKEDPNLKIGEANDRTVKGGSDFVWSLKDINFSIDQGDTLGIIGRNGAGKSTLLKILSRVTSPTTGSVKVKGRVASLLEVGTGFHPELSGRDNIFLNGAILGMTRAEIRRKFDEIVDFAGVERYVDTPVKRYSSGMYVRLAFAVAAFLEPEILIVDEVLAVGDVEFQKKCLGKMKDVSDHDGRTIIFVSHSMPMIASLCKRGIVLTNGNMVYDGSASAAGHFYQNAGKENTGFLDYIDRARKPGDHLGELLQAWVEDMNGVVKSELQIGDGFKVVIRYITKDRTALPPLPNFHFFDQFNQYVLVSSPMADRSEEGLPGEYIAECLIPPNFFNTGHFSIG